MSTNELELHFDVIGPLGSGGQADVLLVRLRTTGGFYACKLLREAWDPFAREQFRREGLRQQRVAGEHVVPVIAFNFDAERPFIVLEYMPHGSLADELGRRGRLGAIEALSMLKQVAVALANLHARGVVHRDVKPGNILLSRDGQLKLNDLGLAATLTSSEHIRASCFAGTPAYAAPEQMLGLASPKSDVFALGVMLHEFVVGVPSPRSVVPSALLGPASQHINGLIGRLCRSNARERPSASEVVGLLDEALRAVRMTRLRLVDPAGVVVPPSRPAPAKTANPWGALFGGAAALATLAFISRSGSTYDPAVDRYRGRDGRFRSG